MATAKPKLLAALALLLLVFAAAYSYRVYEAQIFKTPFSQEEYDEGYVTAFSTNAVWGTAQWCYAPEYWSMQEGYDDGLRRYRELYPAPNGYDLHASQRLAEVYSIVESSQDFEANRKKQLLEELDESIKFWRKEFEKEIQDIADDKKQQKRRSAARRRSAAEKATMTDPRDGETYATVTIGNQTWMAENFRYEIEGSMLNPDNPSKIYGRLYDGDAAQKACPDGWHLPTDSEWNELEVTLGMAAAEAAQVGWRGDHSGKMKSTEGWLKDGSGTNSSGFNVYPSGFYYPAQASSDGGPGALDGLGSSTGFWALDADGKMWVRFVGAPREGVNRMEAFSSDGFMNSCRYIKD